MGRIVIQKEKKKEKEEQEEAEATLQCGLNSAAVGLRVGVNE